uniref:NADH dehydrogenase subunit 6 n=1 Tax=Megaris sp. TaxID=2931300 RepID=A0A8T9ZW50_9HEMI|nr:NADH dehydrogenase subunit 6 [Megaris sp.]
MIFMESLIISMSFLFIWLKHPMSMGICLITLTVIMAMLMNILLKSSMLAYILIIIMLSGVMVLFIYMASVASNEKFHFSWNLLTMFLLINIIFMTTLNYSPFFYKNMVPMMTQDYSMILSIYMYPNNYMILFIIMLLLMMMLVVFYLVTSKEGPLRMKF